MTTAVERKVFDKGICIILDLREQRTNWFCWTDLNLKCIYLLIVSMYTYHNHQRYGFLFPHKM